MRKKPFGVAFVGDDQPGLAPLMAGLSPAVAPRSFRCWDDLEAVLSSDAPELVVLLPGALAPSTPPGVPLIHLGGDDIAKTVAEIEARLLASPGFGRATSPVSRLLGPSAAMARVRGSLAATARASLPLLLTGENGTGKDLAATVAHELSPRAGQAFIAVNCGAVPPGLAETEFFGSVRGAFTGAETRPGFCQLALGGTLFLDEIGELAPEIQAKLLRVLENKEIRRIGSGRVEAADFRVICATNRDLPAEVKSGRFREDLYYRINVLSVRLPALRERLEDLPVLTRHFLESETELDRVVRVGRSALAKMAEYSWPGNLRQLRNVVLRAAILHRGTEIGPEHLEWEE